jgi:uncharacterized SAM-binding protein YcdF (DUF218 family)
MSPLITKALWLIVNPANALTALLVLGALLLFTPRWRIGRMFVSVGAVSALIIAYCPLEILLMRPLQSRFPPPAHLPDRVAGIVVLGGAVDTRQSRLGRVALNSRAERLTAFVDLARRYPEAKLVYTGGASNEPQSEAEIAKPLLLMLGLSEARLILETRSRDTYENAVFTRDLVRPAPGETWIVITSAAHMPRAIGAFRGAGWSVIPFPVDYRRLGDGDDTFGRHLGRGLNLLNAALREWLGLAHYYVSGRSSELFPGP